MVIKLDRKESRTANKGLIKCRYPAYYETLSLFCSFVAWDNKPFQSSALYQPPAVGSYNIETFETFETFKI